MKLPWPRILNMVFVWCRNIKHSVLAKLHRCNWLDDIKEQPSCVLWSDWRDKAGLGEGPAGGLIDLREETKDDKHHAKVKHLIMHMHMHYCIYSNHMYTCILHGWQYMVCQFDCSCIAQCNLVPRLLVTGKCENVVWEQDYACTILSWTSAHGHPQGGQYSMEVVLQSLSVQQHRSLSVSVHQPGLHD